MLSLHFILFMPNLHSRRAQRLCHALMAAHAAHGHHACRCTRSPCMALQTASSCRPFTFSCPVFPPSVWQPHTDGEYVPPPPASDSPTPNAPASGEALPCEDTVRGCCHTHAYHAQPCEATVRGPGVHPGLVACAAALARSKQPWHPGGSAGAGVGPRTGGAAGGGRRGGQQGARGAPPHVGGGARRHRASLRGERPLRRAGGRAAGGRAGRGCGARARTRRRTPSSASSWAWCRRSAARCRRSRHGACPLCSFPASHSCRSRCSRAACGGCAPRRVVCRRQCVERVSLCIVEHF